MRFSQFVFAFIIEYEIHYCRYERFLSTLNRWLGNFFMLDFSNLENAGEYAKVRWRLQSGESKKNESNEQCSVQLKDAVNA